jgi:hypothetical protein
MRRWQRRTAPIEVEPATRVGAGEADDVAVFEADLIFSPPTFLIGRLEAGGLLHRKGFLYARNGLSATGCAPTGRR